MMTEINKTMHYDHEAMDIIYKHTAALCYTWYDDDAIEKKSYDEMLENIRNGCAFIIAEKWMNGEYTTPQYFAIRNEVGKILDAIYLREH